MDPVKNLHVLPVTFTPGSDIVDVRVRSEVVLEDGTTYQGEQEIIRLSQDAMDTLAKANGATVWGDPELIASIASATKDVTALVDTQVPQEEPDGNGCMKTVMVAACVPKTTQVPRFPNMAVVIATA